MKILYFGDLKDITLKREEIIDLEAIRIKELKNLLSDKYPQLRESFLKNEIRIIINGKDYSFTGGDETLVAKDFEIALFSPVGGG
ncbi:MAG: ThiS family protein [Candidatus Methanofastidiosum methylothiophilum]|uniref:ThiS family protein n=1 Tax=Candidatus Methanofastidiosum methylothiophilum TaxID=1705564 RepID=A0A150ILX8_9EURY|nr:MAG: ThiS family protein [Candidatus Methanofastidiosum methylthiophilus]KYC48626.1 MAG: ThiS family protein [Candidatus Methanofastidiosum methylthiophilus]KYC51169.1 MAG: ThiS family protein [Candidatus Methanofastidiosum methylthiophilus]